MRSKYLRIPLIFIFIIAMSVGNLAICENSYASETGAFEAEVIKLVNIERAKHFLSPLQLDSALIEPAKIRANEITTHFDHKRPNGSPFYTVSPKAYGENLAAGYKTAKEVVKAWMKSPGHKSNILDSDFTTIAIGYKHISKDTKQHYYYLVQLFGIDSSFIPKISKVTGFKASSTNVNKVTLQWKKSSKDISGYYIFRYNSKTKKFNPIKHLSSKYSKFTNTKLSTGSSYIYKIKPYKLVNGEKYFGSFSSKLKVNTLPSKPNFILKSGKKKVTIKWNKVSRASGYQIFASTRKYGKYKLQKDIKSPSITKFTKNGLKKKQTYYFKVRSYKKVDNKKVYSSLSGPKKVRTK